MSTPEQSVRRRWSRLFFASAVLAAAVTIPAQQMVTETRDPAQAQDEDFAKSVKEWTTQPYFISPLVDHLPKVPGIPMPKDVLGYHIGAPGKLTYYEDILKYYRALAAATPRVKVETIGKSDEDRELVVVWVSSDPADVAGGSLTPYVKDAYLRWTFHGRQQLTLGIQPSLSFEQVEAVWDLRHIEKTPLDLYRWDSSRDTGVTVSGPINQSGTWRYGAQFGNESGNDAETDEFKAYRTSVRYDTNPGLMVEGMLAQFERDQNADRTTAQIFAGYRAGRARAGLLYTFQKRREADDGSTAEVTLDIISAFGVVDVKPQKISAFVRVDRHADPCADCANVDYLPIDPGAAFTLTIAGIEYYIHPSVRFSPNIEWVAYGTPAAANATPPPNDLVVRLTFFWSW